MQQKSQVTTNVLPNKTENYKPLINNNQHTLTHSSFFINISQKYNFKKITKNIVQHTSIRAGFNCKIVFCATVKIVILRSLYWKLNSDRYQWQHQQRQPSCRCHQYLTVAKHHDKLVIRVRFQFCGRSKSNVTVSTDLCFNLRVSK